MRTVVTFVACAICSSVSAAPKDVLLPPKSEYQHDGQLVDDTDKFQETRSLHLLVEKIPVSAGSTRCRVGMGAAFSWEKGKPKPEAVLGFFVRADDWVNLKTFNQFRENTLTMLIDGERREFTFAFDTDFGTGGIRESSYMSLPLDDLATIVNAKKVEVQIGSVEFALDQNAHYALNDFASHIPRQQIGNFLVKDDPDALKRIAEQNEMAAEREAVQAQLNAEQKEIEKQVAMKKEAERNEKVAAGKLRLAEKYKEMGKIDFYEATLKDLVEKYKNTEAAKKAQKLLDE